MSEMGLDDAGRYPQFTAAIKDARAKREELKAIADVHALLEKGMAENSLAGLSVAMGKAKDLGVDDDVTARAATKLAQLESMRDARSALETAISGSSVEALEGAISAAVSAGVEETDTLIVSGRRMVEKLMQQQQALAALESAIAENTSTALADAIQAAKECGATGEALERAETKLAGLGAEAAAVAGLMGAMSVEELDAAVVEAEAAGVSGEALERAAAYRRKLEAQKEVAARLQAAIDAGNDFDALKSTLKDATSCGLDTNTKEESKALMAAAKQLEASLAEGAEACKALKEAMQTRDKAAIESGLQKVRDAGAGEWREAKQAEDLLAELGLEDALITKLRAALDEEPQDKDAIKQLYEKAVSMNIDNDTVAAAAMIANREETIKKRRTQKIDKATAEGDLDMMNEAMQACIQLGLEGPGGECPGDAEKDEGGARKGRKDEGCSDVHQGQGARCSRD